MVNRLARATINSSFGRANSFQRIDSISALIADMEFSFQHTAEMKFSFQAKAEIKKIKFDHTARPPIIHLSPSARPPGYHTLEISAASSLIVI